MNCIMLSSDDVILLFISVGIAGLYVGLKLLNLYLNRP